MNSCAHFGSTENSLTCSYVYRLGSCVLCVKSLLPLHTELDVLLFRREELRQRDTQLKQTVCHTILSDQLMAGVLYF